MDDGSQESNADGQQVAEAVTKYSARVLAASGLLNQSHENTYIRRNNTHYTFLLHMVTHNITYDNII